MNPSEYEIQREVENLRDIKRRSSTQGGPGALLIDPDLPEQSATGSHGNYWTAGSTESDELEGTSSEDASDQILSPTNDDPANLFWVPARLHPEIAPSEFSAFLKEHTRVAADGSTLGLSRTASSSSTSSLGRKKSMLRNQYRPTANDGVEHESVKPLRRNRSTAFPNAVPQLTISDLQKLEELAEEASKSDDPSKLRSILRRSMSMNVAPSAIDRMDDLPLADEGDAPIIVPPQPLRRAARTKIRKPGVEGTGNTRFSARRRTSASARIAAMEAQRTSSDISSSDHDHSEEAFNRPPLPHAAGSFMDEAPALRPKSFEDEHERPHSLVTSIYEAYASDDVSVESDEISIRATSPPSAPAPVLPLVHEFPPPQNPIPIASPQPIQAQQPVIHSPQPQRMLSPPNESQTPSRTPSPEGSMESVPHLRQASAPETTSPSSVSSPGKKDKDKKGSRFKWGSDKSSKKAGKGEREKEKDSGFFGSLFGGGKKKQEESASTPIGSGTSGREAAAALLGASKAKSRATSPAPQPGGPYARYPIHVERAIYRLSHIKLANPRRPLYEQVLISNLMFWYLGVINKTTQPPTPSTTPPPGGQTTADQAEKEKQEREKREKEEREKAEKERIEKERERERERERLEQQKRESSKRGTLTKPGAPGAGARRAEMPVRSPQYDMQHRSMEQEYGGGSGYGQPPSSAPPIRTGGAPPPPSTAVAPYGYSRDRTNSSPTLGQPFQYPPGTAPMYYGDGGQPRPAATPHLPPGAMPPAQMEQAWLQQNPARTAGGSSHPPMAAAAYGGGRAPPQSQPNRYAPAQQFQQFNGGSGFNGGGGGGANGLKGRSLSATAVAPQPNGGGMLGKPRASSAHAVAPKVHGRPRTADGAPAGEEDVPLALWQQQHRR
ncbi:hypothetical protein PUNSTDRAFT_113087 [Punctularia strigosozonata HHB-11173 SS5]|uniref:uncharacterized protein n=1 Tax=Punctularia strigosozonata (strain HHB-11173) TaxID=741275 RepID=UPI0004416636|nr:uncharacterized protein PUNSTDRAFT_113087 [Punctularia strigosozonata HHB-11173 SS5]EIN09657.1 hypothetical protein PUNSTDRAFT_113087 [Punctularia strigosozonata HHB-11173 SS5]